MEKDPEGEIEGMLGLEAAWNSGNSIRIAVFGGANVEGDHNTVRILCVVWLSYREV